jgi:outer membrane protein insertion porin family
MSFSGLYRNGWSVNLVSGFRSGFVSGFSFPTSALFPLLRQSGLCLILLLSVCSSALAQEAAQANPPQPAERETFGLVAPPPNLASKVGFIGNTSFTREELLAGIRDPLLAIAQEGVTEPVADDLAYYVEVFYRRRGYPAVEARYRIAGGNVFIDIREGRYYGLGEVYFVGNRTFPPDQLKEYMVGTTRQRFPQSQKQLPFVEADLVQGTALLQGFYVSEGFPQVNIEKLATRPDERRGVVDATVTIREGPRFFFGAITMTREPQIPASAYISKLGEYAGGQKPYTEAARLQLERDLTYIYKTQGHYSAAVTAQADFAAVRGGRVPIRVTPLPGPLYRFGAIEQQQIPPARLRPEFLPKRFRELRGETYDPRKLQAVYNDLILTGLYDSIDLQEIPEPDNTLRLRLTPREAKQKQLRFVLGYQTYDGPFVGAGYRDLNINGYGHIFDIAATYTGRGPSGEISYDNPWLFDSKFGARAVAGIDLKAQVGYSINQQRARLEVYRRNKRNAADPTKGTTDTSLFVQFKNVSLDEIKIDREFVGPTSYQLVTLGVSQILDYRDNPISPRKGWIVDGSGSISQGVNNDARFATFAGRYSTYFGFGKTLLAVGARVGYIADFGSTGQDRNTFDFNNVPIEERFFNGGAFTVRSFAERELGEKDSGNRPVGGLARSILNIEYQVPIVGDLFGAAFIDAGGLGDTPFESMSLGVGLGIRYNSPVGPLRIDYGVNPAPRSGEDFGAFHLGFGVAF